MISSDPHKVLKVSWIESPLGSMLAVADDRALYLLEFGDCRGFERACEQFQRKTKLSMMHGKTEPIEQIEEELEQYFSGKLQEFKTPLCLVGSLFQKRVWEELKKIPVGETRSYRDIALAIGNPSAFRACALANGANHVVIAIPCHRVIKSDGSLGGYGGGIKKKEWLLKHERNEKALLWHTSGPRIL